MSLVAAVSDVYRHILGARSPERLGIALSGGSDSTALLLLTRSALPDVRLYAATVDHRLREGSTAEAEAAGQLCSSLGIPHEILPWEGWAGRGNLQDAARSARRALLSDWSERHGLEHVSLGHTQDDQAETVLLRLARGSGVDGLAAMVPASSSHGVTWLRPLLALSRDALREYLRAEGQGWADDPSNDDSRFDRVKARQMYNTLAPLGLTSERLARTAEQMSLARAALNHYAAGLLSQHAKIVHGDILLSFPEDRPRETVLRAFAHCLGWTASTAYRPRYDALTAALAAPRPVTLHGCRITPENGALRITREYAAVADIATPPAALWDGRWRLFGPPPAPGAHVAALGEVGLAECPDWRAAGLPRASLLATPALWLGDRLLSAPVAGRSEGYAARLCHGLEHLVSSLSPD